MNDRYPIPPDGEVLHAHHLKGQTLFTLRQAGRVLGGAWGFFRPADLEATANRIHLDDREVVIENLALVSPGGFALRADELRRPLTGESATMHLTWVLPEGEAGTDRESRSQTHPDRECSNHARSTGRGPDRKGPGHEPGRVHADRSRPRA